MSSSVRGYKSQSKEAICSGRPESTSLQTDFFVAWYPAVFHKDGLLIYAVTSVLLKSFHFAVITELEYSFKIRSTLKFKLNFL